MLYCSACGCKIPDGSKFCNQCGASVQIVQPTSVQKASPAKNKILGAAIMVFGGLCFIALSLGHPDKQSPHSIASIASIAPDNRDEAERLLANCGEPSSDESTEYDRPRPIIPTRMIEYEEKKLRFAFVPGSGKLGDPPPYRWKLVGATDMTSRDPSHARGVKLEEITLRMPCWAYR